jgi:lysophospholipase L1-like esterase
MKTLLMAMLALTPAVAVADTISAANDLQPADSKYIQYTGRIDFSNPMLPRFWAPGVTIRAKFKGTYCDAVFNDEVLWGTSHNWIEVVVDDRPPVRIATTGPTNVIPVAKDLPDGVHTVTLCKDTEATVGYLEFAGFRCAGLVKPDRLPKRKIEFIGDSITCGYGNDTSAFACGQGQVYDHANAYMAYGPVAARSLNAQWVLTSYSGIGLIHSCCDIKILMPEVVDEVNLSGSGDPGKWDFKRYQPDVVTVCLGQNDGSDNPDKFREAYVDFIHTLREDYPEAQIVCLTSPMADFNLAAMMTDNLKWVVDQVNQAGDKNVHYFVLSHNHNRGCGTHPDMAEDQQIAGELATELTSVMHW